SQPRSLPAVARSHRPPQPSGSSSAWSPSLRSTSGSSSATGSTSRPGPSGSAGSSTTTGSPMITSPPSTRTLPSSTKRSSSSSSVYSRFPSSSAAGAVWSASASSFWSSSSSSTKRSSSSSSVYSRFPSSSARVPTGASVGSAAPGSGT